MRVSVIGTGYVGLVAGACFADLGNEVTCADIDDAKIRALEKGKIPIYEPGLEELVKKNAAEKRLTFTTDTRAAVENSEIIFIAVGTPQSGSGQADLTYVHDAAKMIGRAMNGPKIVVDKSTVPVGTCKQVKKIIEKESKGRHSVSVVSNPEFLREGCALGDFMRPDRVVIGSDDDAAAKAVAGLYRPLDCEIVITSPESAELIKYASNAFLATKISFINEIAAICEKVGADVSQVALGIGLDKRIGKQFLSAGSGYGGSCFPKDVKALQKTATTLGYDFGILREVERINTGQKTIAVRKLEAELGNLKGKKIALFGLAFKPETDDMREAPSIEIIRLLASKGTKVAALDPAAEQNAKKILGEVAGLEFAKDAYSASKGADAIVLITEWNEFLGLDYAKIAAAMNSKLIIDGRNALDKEKLKSLGFKYVGVGR